MDCAAEPLVQFTAEVWIVSIVFVVVVLGGIGGQPGSACSNCSILPRRDSHHPRHVSSEAVMAPLMLKLEQLGCEQSIVGMVMPRVTPSTRVAPPSTQHGRDLHRPGTNTHLSLADELWSAGADAYFEGIGRGCRSGICYSGRDAIDHAPDPCRGPGPAARGGAVHQCCARRHQHHGNGVATIVVAKWNMPSTIAVRRSA